MQVEQGPGWRFGVDPARAPFAALVGGEGWAAELTLGELQALRDGALRLRAELQALAPQLMPEEQITLELERDALWLELEGQGGAWALRFVLQPTGGGRGLEGSWSAAATAALLAVWEQLP